MTKTPDIITNFRLNGELINISFKKEKIKYLNLKTETGEYWIKVSRQLREQIIDFPLGCQLEIAGIVKQSAKTAKYKAETIMVIAPEGESTSLVAKNQTGLPTLLSEQKKPKAKVLICGKSNCWKKGGQKVYQEIESTLKEYGLSKAIPIKQTGCLKQCKKAPSLVMMPDKAQYNRVEPKQVAKLVTKHLLKSE